ncbi:AAA family ATPase [Patescibacteria group bacterium]|nr:AAA family ATPase [Patescibacteria group bacterium]
MAINSEQFEWPPLGQDRAISFLEKSIISGKLAQSYIFSGPKDLGKSSLALAFARNLWHFDRQEKSDNDNFSSLNTDLSILEKETDKKQIGVEQVREFIKILGMSSFLDSYKIGIIKNAELLSIEAQNALLKTLEEPREKVLIILITENVELLAATIASRAQVLYFYPVATASVYDYLLASTEVNRSLAKELAAASMGRPLQALYWTENPIEYKAQSDLVQQLFDFLEMDLGERLSLVETFSKASDVSVDKVKVYLHIWEGLWHDALLISLGDEAHLRYPSLRASWQKYWQNHTATDQSYQAFLSLKQLQQADKYLRGFVNPKNILESLSLYF